MAFVDGFIFESQRKDLVTSEAWYQEDADILGI